MLGKLALGVLFAAFAMLVVMRSGFYPLTFCDVGIATAIAALACGSRAAGGAWAGPALLAAVGCAALASVVANGATVSMLAEALLRELRGRLPVLER